MGRKRKKPAAEKPLPALKSRDALRAKLGESLSRSLQKFTN